MVGEVPVMRPMSAWADPSNPLNRHVEGTAWSEITAEEGLVGIGALLEEDQARGQFRPRAT
jgi:hypothetical protein